MNYTMFVAWIFYGLGAASIFAYRLRHRELPRPYLVPLYPWTPLLFVLAAAALVLNVIVSTPRNAAIGLGILAIVLPAYLLWRKRGAEPFEATRIQPTEELE